MESPQTVQQAFQGTVTDFILVPNDLKLRERASFIDLLKRVESRSNREATFYAHGKGVATRGNTKGVMYWRNLMYHVLLDNPEQIDSLLLQFPIVGTHRRTDLKRMPDGLPCPWHFAGTFYWFRHDAFFSRQWKSLPLKPYAVEAMPGLLYKLEEGICLAKDRIRDPYSPTNYSQEERIYDPGVVLDKPVIKVELGGGSKPHGNGFLNVDRCASADIELDLEALATRPLPFDDDSVSEVYSSHCLEHIVQIVPLMREIVRICFIGAKITIRVPHWLSSMAMCHDHKQVIAPPQIEHWTKSELKYWWAGGPKKLELVHTEYTKGPKYRRWQQLLPAATHDDLMTMCPDAGHESCWTFCVVANT